MKTKILFLMLLALSASKLHAQCSATFIANINPNGTVYFTATGGNPASTLYFWSFGNGTSGTGQTPIATYNAAGTYTACLYVNDTLGGCVDSSCQAIVITGGNIPCQAGFYIYEDSINGPHTYIGVNTSVFNGNSTFAWSWGDGNYANGFNPPAHTYAAAGMYNICLVVSGGGCVDTFCSNENINKVSAEILSVTFGAAPAGVNDITKAESNKIYPNPASDLLFINDAKAGKYQYEIYSVSGSKVLSGHVSGNEGIHVSSLPVNLYLIKITDSNGKSQYAKFTRQ